MKILIPGILIPVALLSLHGCQETQFERDNNSVASSNTEVLFTSHIVSRVTDNTWEIDDHIGVFMFRTGTSLSDETIINYASNMNYTYTEGAKFQPATSDDCMYYPAKEAVDFIAYYPYKSVENYTVSIDLTRQQDPAAIDLLYSNNLKNIQNTTETQTLTFRHQLSRLIFHIKAGEGLNDEKLEDFNVLVKNIPSQVSLNLASAAITPEEASIKDIHALVQGTTAYAIVSPGESRGKEITVILPSGEYKFQISNESANWESGYQYTYSLTLNKNNNTPTLEAEIEPWIDGKGEDLENSESDIIAQPWDGQTADTDWYDAESNAFTLNNAKELAGLAKLVNTGTNFQGKTITLSQDLDLNNHPFTPIGNDEHPFAGTLDGNQKQIIGYAPQYINANNTVALIGTNQGTVKNLTIIGSGIINYEGNKAFKAGNFVGNNAGNVEGCCSYVKIRLTATASDSIQVALGGIAGVNTGNISHCQNYGALEYTSDSPQFITTFMGGIAGLVRNGTVSQSDNHQNLTAQGSTISLGGICGERNLKDEDGSKIVSSILTCNNYGDITLSNATVRGYAGGIIGKAGNWATVQSCANMGNITTASVAENGYIYAGGIAGRAVRCTFRDDRNSGLIESKNSENPSYTYGGGIAGYLSSDCEIHTSAHAAEASVTSNGWQGGIVGNIASQSENTFVYDCNQNLGTPKKWIGSAKGNNDKEGVSQDVHEDE